MNVSINEIETYCFLAKKIKGKNKFSRNIINSVHEFLTNPCCMYHVGKDAPLVRAVLQSPECSHWAVTQIS